MELATFTSCITSCTTSYMLQYVRLNSRLLTYLMQWQWNSFSRPDKVGPNLHDRGRDDEIKSRAWLRDHPWVYFDSTNIQYFHIGHHWRWFLSLKIEKSLTKNLQWLDRNICMNFKSKYDHNQAFYTLTKIWWNLSYEFRLLQVSSYSGQAVHCFLLKI